MATISGIVQLGGKVNVGMYEKLGSGRFVCDLWVDVVSYYGKQPKPGARWRYELIGADSVDELRIKARARIDALKASCEAGLIVGFRGSEDRYPYQRSH